MKMEDALLIKFVEDFRASLDLLSQKIDASTEANKSLKMGIVAVGDMLTKRLELIENGSNREIQGINLVQSND